MVELTNTDPATFGFFSTDFGASGEGVASPYVCIMFVQTTISASVEIKGLAINVCIERLSKLKARRTAVLLTHVLRRRKSIFMTD